MATWRHSGNSIGSNEKSGRTDGRVIGGHGNRFIWPDSGHDGRQRNQKVGRPSIDLPTTTETVIRKKTTILISDLKSKSWSAFNRFAYNDGHQEEDNNSDSTIAFFS